MPGGLELGETHLISFIENFTGPAKILHDNGAKLFYHNHDMEFRKCADGDMIIIVFFGLFMVSALVLMLAGIVCAVLKIKQIKLFLKFKNTNLKLFL